MISQDWRDRVLEITLDANLDSEVARSAHTPVYAVARSCLSLLPRSWRFSYARVILIVLSTGPRHRRVSRLCQRIRIEPYPWHARVFLFPRPCPPIKFTYGHSHSHGDLSHFVF
ncbi:hypothetical protein GOBAR_AA25675 [Gossypium barbadense]|uniref:Uncharacterized protein n=1 Tax=Gossypium barbadense TaxID=3634 RepID=A0A2P5WV75_GOSBA|nr:hypothetical protein GOBAR_AA25675 [Gossypium barbadense]